VPADHDVHAGDFRDGREIALVADMGESDDLVDALLLQFGDRRGDAGDVVGDKYVWTRRGDDVGVVGDGADDADLLAADIENGVGLDAVTDPGVAPGNDVGADNREMDVIEEGGEPGPPSSNSWLPTVIASTLKRSVNSASTAPL
jgi:hypothetical protein